MDLWSLWNTWSWKTSWSFTILGCPSQSFRAVISFWVLASILQNQIVNIYLSLPADFYTSIPSLIGFIYSAYRLPLSKYQNEISTKVINHTTHQESQTFFFLKKNFPLSQKRTSLTKKRLLLLPVNLVTLCNHEGNNPLPEQLAGLLSVLKATRRLNNFGEKYFKLPTNL